MREKWYNEKWPIFKISHTDLNIKILKILTIRFFFNIFFIMTIRPSYTGDKYTQAQTSEKLGWHGRINRNVNEIVPFFTVGQEAKIQEKISFYNTEKHLPIDCQFSLYVKTLSGSVYFSFTGNLITMLRLLKNKMFSSAVYRIIKNVKTIFETLDTRLLEALCNVNWMRENMMSDRSTQNGSGEKIPFDSDHRN